MPFWGVGFSVSVSPSAELKLVVIEALPPVMFVESGSPTVTLGSTVVAAPSSVYAAELDVVVIVGASLTLLTDSDLDASVEKSPLASRALKAIVLDALGLSLTVLNSTVRRAAW